jgi:predicted nucleic acid binding AN1-type Zn finger protein
MYHSNIGKTCHWCKNHDYLPVYCDLCKYYFCKNHSSLTNHKCSGFNENQNMNVKVPSQKKEQLRCYYCKSKISKTYSLDCAKCNKTFCIKHRLDISHNCPSLNLHKTNKHQKHQQYNQHNNQHNNQQHKQHDSNNNHNCPCVIC